MDKSILKRMLITNIGIVLVIAFVAAMAFLPLGEMLRGDAPVLKGSTGSRNIALQIAVGKGSDVAGYMDALDELGAKGTFFFCERDDEADTIRQVEARGHGIGYYTYEDGQRTTLYVGGGYSLPVMSYDQGSRQIQVCPSIDITKLMKQADWAKVLEQRVGSDMFLYIDADNNFSVFEKIVQIVLDKGYTILKINEML